MLVDEKQIPEGYKKTEVGLIPEDWNIVPLMHISEKIMVGIASSATHAYRNKGIPLLRNQNIKSNKLDDDDIIYISEDYEKGFLNKRLKEGDLLTARTGYPGTTCLVPKNFENAQSFTTLITRLKSNSENPIYLSYFINSEKGQKFFTDNQIGGGQKNVNAATLKRFPVVLPLFNEQQKIATALSDTDALISELEKLIEKKQAIKTATMQQLLTGKTRLPEFALREDGTPKGYKDSELGQIPEDWEIYRLSDVSLIDPENLNSSTSHDYQFEYISLENVDRGILLGTTSQIFSTSPSRARRVVRCGDILISTVRPNLMSHYYFNKPQRDVVCSTGFSLARPIESKLNGLFFYYHLFGKIINNQIDKIVIGSNYPAINSNDVRNFKVMLPSLKEQHSIVKILEQLDSEIAKRTMQLKKLQFIKQGLMQELLTGKTRLV